MNPGEEMVEVVDEDGIVIDVVSRAEMRAGVLRHRSTYVAVVRPDDRLVVHRRADWKDINPGYWDIAFGGVAGVGESWPMAAERELAEEAGVVDVPLTDLGRGAYDAEDGHIVAALFLARTDKRIVPEDGEVVEIGEVPLSDLDAWARSHNVCGDSMALIAPFLRQLAATVPDEDAHRQGDRPIRPSSNSTESPSPDCSKNLNP
ncbi:MAG: NUDIX domain-containing protein [Acidimicrobiales bacterium]|nr:NUDIX domain-containing protein [Acidimicrobiales bacterium]